MKNAQNKKTMRPMVLVALGIVYGDIATSPMYVMKSIANDNGGIQTMSTDFVLGALSLVIWTITLITTVKYVLIAMKADNNGEGGIFALYSLVRRVAKWLLIPAMIGGAALLADGVLTPAVTVTNAIEGLRIIPACNSFFGESPVGIMAVVIAILVVLFVMQRAGTSLIGKFFGPIMIVWFVFISVAGICWIVQEPIVFRAFNPAYAVRLLLSSENVKGIWILGSVFLATTGAEALYSDMGHVGKRSIYISWPIVKVSLILNYLGQGAWLLMNNHNSALVAKGGVNPFYDMLTWLPGLDIIGVILGACAAIIASQALITGSFSIVSEAIRLNLLPPLHTFYPSETKGQLYIPLVNNLLMVGCIFIVVIFQTSSHMEAAYGLAITVTLLATSILLTAYLFCVRKLRIVGVLYALCFGVIEVIFFISCLGKFVHGGFVALLIAILIAFVMIVWHRSGETEKNERTFVPVDKFIGQLDKLRSDEQIPTYTDNLVYLTTSAKPEMIERDVLYSILDKDPKRAKTYWFVNINVTGKPHTHKYKVETFGTDFIYRVTLRLGFKEDQMLGIYLKQIVADMLKSGEFKQQSRKYTVFNYHDIKRLRPQSKGRVGRFKYCIIHKSVSVSSDLTEFQLALLTMRQGIRKNVANQASWYGLEASNVQVEYVPFFIPDKRQKRLTRN